jgi:RNA polymerase sigma-70 factor (ECF subfamily)
VLDALLDATSLVLSDYPGEGPPRDRALTLVEVAQGGDVSAFETLYREHVGRVYALALRLLGNVPEAEAMTQDVFVHAWERLPRFRGESSLATWLHRICVSLVLMHHRSTARRVRRIESVEDLERLDPRAPASSPDEKMDLERAIRRLPEGARIVFVLHDIEGYAHAEIAEQMSIAENTCKAQLHRARKLLREVLDAGA